MLPKKDYIQIVSLTGKAALKDQRNKSPYDNEKFDSQPAKGYCDPQIA